MTKITISVSKPNVKMTDSDLYKAVRGIRTGAAEIGIIPNPNGVNVEFYSRNKGMAWDAYHDFRKAYTQSIISCDVSTGKNTVRLFNRA